MKKVQIWIFAGLLVLLSNAVVAQQPGKYIIDPGEVVLSSGSNTQMVSGSITLRSSPNGHASMRGGGCLVYISVPNAQACHTDKDCGPGGYCASPDSGPMSNSGKVCWHQPDQASCHKSPDKDLQVDKTERFDNATAAYPAGATKPIRWRVVSCQNLVEFGCKGDDEAGRAYLFGKTKEFK